MKQKCKLSPAISLFFQVLKVRAVDGDRGINNRISYEIIDGPVQQFAITPDTGIVYTKTAIDRESNNIAANGAFILAIRAYEEGGTQSEKPFVDTEVTIMIEVISTTFNQTKRCIDCVTQKSSTAMSRLISIFKSLFEVKQWQAWHWKKPGTI